MGKRTDAPPRQPLSGDGGEVGGASEHGDGVEVRLAPKRQKVECRQEVAFPLAKQYGAVFARLRRHHREPEWEPLRGQCMALVGAAVFGERSAIKASGGGHAAVRFHHDPTHKALHEANPEASEFRQQSDAHLRHSAKGRHRPYFRYRERAGGPQIKSRPVRMKFVSGPALGRQATNLGSAHLLSERQIDERLEECASSEPCGERQKVDSVSRVTRRVILEPRTIRENGERWSAVVAER